jgi:O-acetyl-ADP-ribose deacetylase (regulator of RNase III)
MINYINGDLLKVTVGIIAHGCNAQGVMGSGVARSIRTKYPEAYLDYLLMPKKLGEVSLVQVSKNLQVASCITQQFYGRDPKVQYVSYPAIEECFSKLPKDIPIHIPKIGAGLANGDWEVISKIISNFNLDVTCWIL